MKSRIIRYVDGVAGGNGTIYVNKVLTIISGELLKGWSQPRGRSNLLVIDKFQQANHQRPPMSESDVKEEMKKWTTYCVFDNTNNYSPEQTNGIDCGLLMLKYTEHMCFDLPIDYSQSDMPSVRRQICCAIGRGKLFM